MIFQQLNRSDPEKIYVIGKSESAATVKNQLVCWDMTGITANEIAIASTGILGLVAGVLPAAIASGEFGLVQGFGYYPTALITMHTSASTDLAAGCALYAADAQKAFEWAADPSVDDGTAKRLAYTLEAVTFVTTVTYEQHKVFLRCL